MNLEQIRCFDAIVRSGSFRSAAMALHLSQPAVSMHVKKLERDVGVKLLRRSPRGSVLTEAGAEMLPHFRNLLRAEESAHQHATALHGHRGGRVRVAGVNSAIIGLLPRAIRTVAERDPALAVEVSELTSALVFDGVCDGTFDLGVTAGVALIAPEGIECEVLADGPLMLVAHCDHPLMDQGLITRDQVAKQPFVTLREGYSLRRLAQDYLEGHPFRIVGEALNHDTVRRLVAAGLGVTIMPKMTYEIVSGANTTLAARPLPDSDVVVSRYLLYPTDDLAPSTAVVLDALRLANRAIVSRRG